LGALEFASGPSRLADQINKRGARRLSSFVRGERPDGRCLGAHRLVAAAFFWMARRTLREDVVS